ncbi:hypothetical protein BT63DRAFT_464519 [Microthyrium microscopicum]|uniref:F-box domain-containing protein n=1 Tax=Microthyrium microscopicum TaxID=703497 RepID=A0A6A6TXG7_9PEZI|nr:hypothetical protein BT63DRAFT_464519 [Microthyrium microscopicum]
MADPECDFLHDISDTPYLYTQADSMDIIRVCSRPSGGDDFENEAATVISSCYRGQEVAKLAPLQRDSAKKASDLGNLDRIPLEVLQFVILELDLESLLEFRRVNYYVRECVDSVHQFQIMKSHALDMFWTLVRTKLAMRVTLSEFYRVLCTDECAYCSMIGGLVFLPTWTRYCYACLKSWPLEIGGRRGHIPPMPTAMTPLSTARQFLSLGKINLSSLGGIESIPGSYGPHQYKYKGRRRRLIPVRVVFDAFRKKYPSKELTFKKIMHRLRPRRVWTFMSCGAMQIYSPKSGHTRHGLTCAGCSHLNGAKKYVGDEEEEWELEISSEGHHSTNSFLKHFTWCIHAQDLWRKHLNA